MVNPNSHSTAPGSIVPTMTNTQEPGAPLDYKALAEDLADKFGNLKTNAWFALNLLRNAKKAFAVTKNECRHCEDLYTACCSVVDLLHNAIPKSPE